MGSLLEELHEQHKARQARIKGAAIKIAPEPIIDLISPEPEPPPVVVEPPVPAWAKKPPFEIIMSELCAYYAITREDILSSRRRFADQRHMLSYILDIMTVLTYPQIGMRTHRDPTTIRYAIHKVRDGLPNRQQEIDELKARIAPLLK